MVLPRPKRAILYNMARERTREASRNSPRTTTDKKTKVSEDAKPKQPTRRTRAVAQSTAGQLGNGVPKVSVLNDEHGNLEAPDISSALRELRAARNLSLDMLAHESGVSRAMLSQVELGRSTPTITVLWRIARALGVPFSALLASPTSEDPLVFRAKRAKVLKSADGSFSTRALFPLDQPHSAEFYELRLTPRGVEIADAHAPGTTENLIVTTGAMDVRVGGVTLELKAGDATYFQADVSHEYRNPTSHETISYLVMTYAHRS